jgi:hypothetical protein
VERAFSLKLPVPLAGKKTPADRKRHGAYLEVVSNFDSFEGADELTITVHGPSHCAPGIENRVRIQQGKTGEHLPAGFTAKVPVRARLLPVEHDQTQVKERFLRELAPWKWDDLEIGGITVESEACRITNSLNAAIFVYPDLRCRAAGTLQWEQDRRSGEIRAKGDAGVIIQYNGQEVELKLAALQEELEKLCPLPWKDIISILGDLRSAERLAALEGGSCGGSTTLARFSVSGTAALVEKKGSPDVHARYYFQAAADPLVSLNHEFNLLPWLEAALEKTLLEEPLAGLEVRAWPRSMSGLFDGGIFLLARGGIHFSMTFSSSRLAGRLDPLVGKARGLVSFQIEPRSSKPGRGSIIETWPADDEEQETALRVNGECHCEIQPADHQWRGKAGFGGLEIRGARWQSAKVVIYSSLSEKEGCNILILKSNTWWDPMPPE